MKPLHEITMSPPLDKMPKVNHGFYEKRGDRIHGGIDLGCKVGTEIKSIADGNVTAAGALDDKCGDGISIEHADGFKSSYCHLSAVKVKKGDQIQQGQIIGLSGGEPGAPGAGNSKGPHLHLTLKKNGERVDPLEYIDKTISPPEIQSINYSESNPNFQNLNNFDDVFSKMSQNEKDKFVGSLLQSLSMENLEMKNNVIQETLRIRELMK